MTELTVFQQKISAFCSEIELRFNESMAKHTSFRIGGNAEVMAFPKTAEELGKLLKTSALLDSKFAILGAGTNVLAPDAGIRGLVVCLKDCLGGMEQLDEMCFDRIENGFAYYKTTLKMNENRIQYHFYLV